MALVNLAQLYWDIGERERARDVVTRALEALPHEPIAHCNALLYSCDGDPRVVLAKIPAIEAKYPNHPSVLTVIGECHYKLGNWDPAFAYFSRAIKVAGPNSGLLLQIYPLAADALGRGLGGDKGRLAALEFLLEGASRLPGNPAIAAKLAELSKKQD